MSINVLGHHKHCDDILHKFGGDSIITLIGTGGFGVVYKVESQLNCLAIKALDFVEDDEISDKPKRSEVFKEANQEFQHEGLMAILEKFEISSTLYIVSKFYQYETLEQIGGKLKLDEYYCLVIMDQLLDALGYLHSQKLMHRDIKPSNVLVASINPIRVVLSDFGLLQNENSVNNQMCGTLYFLPPEISPDQAKFSYKADIYALGLTIISMMGVTIQFPRTSLTVKGQVIQGLREKLSKQTIDILLDMIHPSSLLRASSCTRLKSRVEETMKKLENSQSLNLEMYEIIEENFLYKIGNFLNEVIDILTVPSTNN